jgi:hypothetical protein
MVYGIVGEHERIGKLTVLTRRIVSPKLDSQQSFDAARQVCGCYVAVHNRGSVHAGEPCPCKLQSTAPFAKFQTT